MLLKNYFEFWLKQKSFWFINFSFQKRSYAYVMDYMEFNQLKERILKKYLWFYWDSTASTYQIPSNFNIRHGIQCYVLALFVNFHVNKSIEMNTEHTSAWHDTKSVPKNDIYEEQTAHFVALNRVKLTRGPFNVKHGFDQKLTGTEKK